ncbi:hypothetical protein Adt_18536 [Abeliophyllum distichum]|uniref:Uncharacterized protein n=1 Tax=Abeliophyllum distichum TaxID=126358 RepID=A0ABD1TJN6_9LAMI
MIIAQGLILKKDVYNIVARFDGKLSKEEAKVKKLSDDLKVVSIEKAQLESDNKIFRFRLDHVVTVEAYLKSKYELKADRAFVAETAVTTSNSNLEDKKLAKAREEVEKVKAKCTNANARALLAYKDDFENTLEYMELSNLFMTTSGEQLAERIGKIHPEWDISFLRYAPEDLPATGDLAAAKIPLNAEN